MFQKIKSAVDSIFGSPVDKKEKVPTKDFYKKPLTESEAKQLRDLAKTIEGFNKSLFK